MDVTKLNDDVMTLSTGFFKFSIKIFISPGFPCLNWKALVKVRDFVLRWVSHLSTSVSVPERPKHYGSASSKSISSGRYRVTCMLFSKFSTWSVRV